MTRRTYTPRPYGALAYDFLASHPRCHLWAKPGMGKTPIVLDYLQMRYGIWGDSNPTLVLAPLRVAQHVWTEEAAKWDHLRGLKVVSVTGTEAERRAALLVPAQVYATNYDNLVWLADHFKTGGRAWPFTRVIPDEATRLKSFRVQQGGKRAQALGRFAHSQVKEWINLTGTPSPNGLKDLWGQNWFIDAGARLGRS